MDISVNGTVDRLTGIFTLASDRDEQRFLAMEALHIVPHTSDEKFSLMRGNDGRISIVSFFGNLDTQNAVIAEKENNGADFGVHAPRIMSAQECAIK